MMTSKEHPLPPLLLLLLLIITSVVSIEMRVCHLPRPELERPGIGQIESSDLTSSLFDTLSINSNAVLPLSISLNVSSFVYKPKGSSAVIRNGEFSVDVRGDYVLALISSSSTSTSLCDDSSPTLGPDVTSLRWATWDFSAPETALGEIFNDKFSYGGVSSSETIFELWGGSSSRTGRRERRGDVPACASETSNGLVLLAQAGSECSIETRVARINFFSEPILVQLSSLMFSTSSSSSSSSSSTAGHFIVSLVDAYYGIEKIELDVSSGTSASYTLSSQNTTLSSGSVVSVCAGSIGPFDVSITIDPTSIALTISCSIGTGSPISITGLSHTLSYAAFGFRATGAMKLKLESKDDVVVTLGSASAMTLSEAFKAPFELYPIAGRGSFARIRMGASQPRALMGVIDVSSQPFNADPTGTRLSTQALQDAVDFCYLYSCTAYLPVGNYLVDNTINMTQLHDLAVEGVVFESGALHRYYNHVLVGEILNSTEAGQRRLMGLPTRATIVLSPSSIGFTDASTLKAVIWSVALLTVNASYVNMDDINYCNVVQSVDVLIGAGNFGAVGLRFRGAQGTSLEDVTVYAGDGAIGVHGLGGSGGTHSNLTIIGGRFGIDGRVAQPGPELNAIRIINSTCAGLIYGGAQTLTLVGASFELDVGIPAIVAGNPLPIAFPASGTCALPSFEDDFGPATTALDGHISIIDSYFKYFNSNSSHISSSSSSSFTSSSNNNFSSIAASGSLVISNSYFENAGIGSEGTIISKSGPPSRSFGCGSLYCGFVVSFLASGGDIFPPVSRFGKDFIFTDPLYSNGGEEPVPSSTIANTSSYPSGVPLPSPGADELVSRHSYNARQFPSFEWLRFKKEGKAAALCAWDQGIKGDGTDEGEALQEAIDTAFASGAALVLPRGVHVTSVSLVIKPGFALIGIARTQSVIVSTRSGLRRGQQSDPLFSPAVLFAASTPLAPTQRLGANGGEVPLGTVVAYLSLYTWQDLDNVTNVHLSSPGIDSSGNVVRNVWRQALNSRLGVDQATFAGKSPHYPPRYVTSHHPSIILGGSGGASGWHIQVFFNDEVGAYSKNPSNNLAFQGAAYRHFLVVNASLSRFYHLNVEHAYSDADSEFNASSEIDVYSLKKENNAVAAWVRNCSGIRIWGHGGNGAALNYSTTERRSIGPDYADSLPSLYRIEECNGCLFANLFHQNGGDTGSPDLWHMLTVRNYTGPPDNSSWTATKFLERPTIVLT